MIVPEETGERINLEHLQPFLNTVQELMLNTSKSKEILM